MDLNNLWDDEQKKKEEWQKYALSEEGKLRRGEVSFFTILNRLQNGYAWERKVIESEYDKGEIEQFKYSFRTTEMWDWFRFAFKHGFSETLIFLLLFPFILLIQLEIIKVFPAVNNRVVVSLLAFFLLFSVNLGFTLFYLYMSRFVVGELTRRMFTPLVWGRAIPLFIKGLFFLIVSYFVSVKFIPPDVVANVAHYLKFIAEKGMTEKEIYYKIYENLPEIRRDFIATAILMFGFAAAPIVIAKTKEGLKAGSLAWIDAVQKVKCKLRLDRLKKRELHIGCGLKIYPQLPQDNFEEQIKPVYITDDERSVHMDVIGTTGVGKTRLMECLVEQDILMGNSVIVIDPKVDWDFLSKVWSATVKSNRVEDFVFISLLHPHLSSGINPLKYYTFPDEIISTIVSTIQAKEKFYVDIAREMTTLIVQGQYFLASQEGKRKMFTYSDILKHVSQEGLRQIRDQLESCKNSENADIIESLVANYEQVINSPRDYFNKVVTTLRTNLANFSHGVIGNIVGKSDDNLVIERLESGKPVICYVMTGAQTFKDKANQLSRVLLAMIDNMAGRLNASGVKLDPPLRIHIDEAYTAMYHGIEHLFDKGRSTGIGLTCYHQSIGQYVEAVGEKLTETIFDNINTFFIMNVGKDDTRRFAAELTGKKLTALPTFSVEGHASMFPNEGWRIPPERFTELPPRVGVLIRKRALNEDTLRAAYVIKTPRVDRPQFTIKPQDLRSTQNEKEIIELLKRYI
ncbi:type IV secretory system conjugative DNA transfer family protein [Desulfurobacterium sp.]